MTSRIGVPLFTRMTVISPVFLLWALTVIMPSSPDDGAAADGRLLVDVTEFVLLVTEFLLSFVGTRAGRKLSSDIDFSFFGASCCVMMHGCGRYERFQSVSARAGFKEDMNRLRPPPQRGRSAYCLDDVNKRSTVLQRRSWSNQSNGRG
jgi:hypothetical protein